VIINVLVFSSLALALICAFVGILRKNQLKEHLSWMSRHTNARSQVLRRQSSFELNSDRLLWNSASHISVGLTLSISLFATGIFVLLWSLSWFVALPVFLFTCFTLCVVFSKDVSSYYHGQCRDWVRIVQRRLLKALPSSWGWLRGLLHVEASQVYAGLRPFRNDHFSLLARAILSRTSGLTASGVDPDMWRHLAQGIVGLGRLDRPKNVWRVLSPRTCAGALNEGPWLELGHILDVILAILKTRDSEKGRHVFPLFLGLWSRIQGHRSSEKPTTQQRDLLCGIDDSVASVHPWLIWLDASLSQLNTEEAYLLADVLSNQLAYTLRVTDPLKSIVSGAGLMPEEPLYSAFCVARVMLNQVPFGSLDLKLRRAIALAGVRLQFSNLPSASRLFSSNLHQPGDKNQMARFVGWANPSLQRDTNSMMTCALYNLWDLSRIDLHHPSQNNEEGEHRIASASLAKSHQCAEFALDTFLQVALSTNVASVQSKLSPRAWTESSQGILFLMASAHAMKILTTWHLRSAEPVSARHPEIRQLGHQLTELLRHDLLACLQVNTDTSLKVVSGLTTCRFPWHRCLEHFVNCLPEEMGALLRFLVREASDKEFVAMQQLDIFAALFPPDSEADHKFRIMVSRYLAKRCTSAHLPNPERTSSTVEVAASRCADTLSLAVAGVAEHSSGQGMDRLAVVQAFNPGKTQLDTLHVPRPHPHSAIDVIHVGEHVSP
jgi:hypothetical protein